MSDDHFHYASDIHGAAEEHHRHYDLENAIDSDKEREIGAEKIYVTGSGYLLEVIADLRSELQETRAKVEAMEQASAEREAQR